MWNKGSEQMDLDTETQGSNRGSQVRKDYNIIDGTTNVRPSTRNNPRRPVSRQINTTEGNAASKMII